ncbi:DUF3828 domain-containing protein [Scandinavium goeteborgense]|uniref:Uncharacterized protein DUF3828 n=1 Tax=Scandinavium goeteborgense TaxID=1851514 RepID=A0A4R6EMS7_SCAGO|nr:DUF3828 domain-containing protein [Scandinavium goeteborgense]TDN60491.1 uncharacterized protein DUF3828 [Scandinavium goeteborgense]
MKLFMLVFCWLMLSACTPSPEQRTKDFYHWYTTEQNKPEPIYFASPKLKGWVAPETLSRLQDALNHPDNYPSFDADYFTYGQDVSEHWPANVIISSAYHVPGGVAVNVMLGTWDEPEMLVYLVVYLRQKKGVWLISRVKSPGYEQFLFTELNSNG